MSTPMPGEPPWIEDESLWRGPDSTINWSQRLNSTSIPEKTMSQNPLPSRSDGSTASYYELPSGATELQDLINHRHMNGQIAEIFRGCYRYGLVEHSEQLRDAKKMKFYAEAEICRLENRPISDIREVRGEDRPPKRQPFIYLATMYTHHPEGRSVAYKTAINAQAFFMSHGVRAVSPIVLGHAVAPYLPSVKANSHAFWMSYCAPLMEAASAIVIFMEKNWEESKGISEELDYAKKNNVPFYFFRDTDIEPSAIGREPRHYLKTLMGKLKEIAPID